MINIFYTSFNRPLEQSQLSAYLSELSTELKEKNSRYLRWQNRHSHLFGRLLLIQALKMHGIERDIWSHIKYTTYDRPYLTLKEFDFNISHSGNYVVCAIGKNTELGIDIEVNKKVDFNNFKMVMNPCQWSEINNAKHPVKEFYKYWTIKESVIKADGRGLSIPLDELKLKNNKVEYENKSWFVQELDINRDYNMALATNKQAQYNMHEINFYDK